MHESPRNYLQKELDARKKYLSQLMERYELTNTNASDLNGMIQQTRLEIEAFHAAVEALKIGDGNVDSKD